MSKGKDRAQQFSLNLSAGGAGFKSVIDESLAYVYTRLLFPFAEDLGP